MNNTVNTATPNHSINQWIKNNTFHHSMFEDVKKLVELKHKSGLKISLCIPTLNEEKTIGKAIILLKAELIERFPLVDEFAIIDSGSTDNTREIAASFGIDSFAAQDILPSLPAQRGKGENLWKAIYQLNGDIIVYIDADIKNIHPRFVYGLIGPLLNNRDTKYVKAFYDRPLAVSDTVIRNSGGGRVTEILTRPLFSLLFPDLTAIIQPLSGEYAARREVLEQLSFPIGYGVETAHLIDIYTSWGMSAFAQVDLDRRVHRNQPISSLGKMSFGILQSFLHRTEQLGIIDIKSVLQKHIQQFQINNNEYKLEQIPVEEIERPPMNTISEYQQKFKKS